jgi:hypothetical protein
MPHAPTYVLRFTSSLSLIALLCVLGFAEPSFAQIPAATSSSSSTETTANGSSATDTRSSSTQSTTANTAAVFGPVEAISAERKDIIERLSSLENEITASTSPLREELQSLRSQYQELLSVYDMHRIALEESGRLTQSGMTPEASFESRLQELRKNQKLESFFYLQQLEDGVLRAEREVQTIEKAISTRQKDLATHTKQAEEFGKQLRLEKDKARDGATATNLTIIEVKERHSRAVTAYRKTEIENLKVRLSIESQWKDLIKKEIEDRAKSVKFTKKTLVKLTQELDADFEKTNEEIRQRQRELNQELARGVSATDQTAKKLSLIQSGILTSYLSLLRTKAELLEFRKQVLSARYDKLHNLLSQKDFLEVQQQMKERISAAEREIQSENQTLSGTIEEFSASQSEFMALPNFREVNDRVRATLRASMMALAEISSVTNSIRFLREKGDFSSSIESRSWAFLDAIVSTSLAVWNFEVFVVDESPVTVGKLLAALFVFLLGIRFFRGAPILSS